jgi:DNA-binding SARP family transcriptional activator
MLLLGPPELRLAGQRVPLTMKKAWALLVALACSGRNPRARLAAQLWPALDESAARRNLRRELARLREASPEGLVHAEGDWLDLHEDVDTDLRHFEAALRRGDHGQALALWRGPLADGLTLGDAPEFDRWLEARRERLRADWRSALLAQAERAPADRALGLWQRLLTDDPLQEQHHRCVMRLHASAGRREAALSQYAQLQTLLREELGLEPVAETQALAASLRGALVAPAAAATVTSELYPARTLLPDKLPFVGRSAEVEAMEDAWRMARHVVIEGVGGVGKTRLALDFVASHGPYAVCRCRSGDRDIPYAAWARALRALAGPQPSRAALGGLPPWACDELARLLPELAGPATGVAPIRSDEERSRFFEGNALGWRALSAENFDAVVLDDWHHADPASLAMLTFVMQREQESKGTTGARIVVLLRSEFDDVTATQWRVLREGVGALHLQLQQLEPEPVLELVRRLSGANAPTRFAARLQRATAGNPFFLSETLRHLLETGLLGVGGDGIWHTPFDDATQDYRELPVPSSVRAAVLARVLRLGDAARRVLEAAALADEPFAPLLLAPACALTELEVVRAIELAVQAQLLREHDAGGFAFAHDLVQQAMDAELSAERRRLVHRRLALGAEAAGAAAAVIAAHHEASGDARRGVVHRLAAADQAQRLHALPEAMAHWRKALDHGAEPSQALRAHQGLMLAARERCEFDTLRAHSEAVQRLSDSGALTTDERAGALIAVADNLVFGNQAAQALEVLDSLPTGPTVTAEAVQGQGLIARSKALRALGRIDEAKACAKAALGLDGLKTTARIELLDVMTLNEIGSGNMAAARAHADAAFVLGTSSGDKEALARARFHRGLTLVIEGKVARAEDELQQAADGFADLGLVYRQRGVLYNLANLHGELQSRYAQALAAVQRGWDLRPALPPGELWVMYRLAFADAHVALGDLGAAWAHAQAAIAAVLERREPQLLLSTTQCTLELLGLLGETGLARQLLLATGSEAVHELRRTAPEYWVAVAQFELGQSDADAARQALGAVPPQADIVELRVRARRALAEAELQLARGDVAAALAQLPDAAAEGMNDELLTRCLALAVRAQAGAGRLLEATLQAAQAQLQRPSAYMPATLQLHRALAGAAQAGIVNAWPEALQRHAEFAIGPAASLQALPGLQAAFVRNAHRVF